MVSWDTLGCLLSPSEWIDTERITFEVFTWMSNICFNLNGSMCSLKNHVYRINLVINMRTNLGNKFNLVFP